jgi:hypothetical protein
MHRLLTLLVFALCAVPFPSRAAQEEPVSLRWQSAAPEAVRRELADRLLADGPVRVLLEDGAEVAGTVEAVGPETFSLRSDPAAEAVTLRVSAVRGLAWDPRPPSRAAKSKAAVARYAQDPQAAVEVHLRTKEVLRGRIGEAADLTFVLVETGSGAERSIGYRDVERIPKPAREVLKDVGTYSLLVLTLPLFVLAALLTGWDGC